MNAETSWAAKCHNATSMRDYLFATLASAAGLGASLLAHNYLSVANVSLILLVAVLVVALRKPMAVAVYTAIVCFFGDNFFFTPPRFTLAVANAEDLITVVLFLAVALVCSRMATRLSSQMAALRMARAREHTLLQLGQQLAGCSQRMDIQRVAVQALQKALDANAALLEESSAGGWIIVAATTDAFIVGAADIAAADWTKQHAQSAGCGTHAVADASCWMLPMVLGQQDHGVMAVALHGQLLGRERRELALWMVRDITVALEQSRLAERLQASQVQAETERLRNALLSSVSHDLRSPLASMIGAASTLASYQEQLPAEERHQLLDAVVQEGRRLDRYIQNLLDMTRLGHGKITLHRDWVDAAELVLSAVARLRKILPDQAVDTSLPRDTCLLYVHPALIEQAIFNVLENAAHFSPVGTSVRIELAQMDGRLQIDVIDQGPGIPPEERARIFDMFYSVARGDRGNKGTGLGLSICQGMIGAHGGDVHALPGTAGTGTTIRISLPLPPAPEEAA